jgi:hypothetical protein
MHIHTTFTVKSNTIDYCAHGKRTATLLRRLLEMTIRPSCFVRLLRLLGRRGRASKSQRANAPIPNRIDSFSIRRDARPEEVVEWRSSACAATQAGSFIELEKIRELLCPPI